MTTSDELYFLEEDLTALRSRLELAETRYRSALGGVHETTTYNSESWHDNPAFDDVQQQSRMYYRQYQELKGVLDRAALVHRKVESGSPRVVQIGSDVALEYLSTGVTHEFTICSYMCFHDDESHISYVSPIGAAVLGAHEDDEVRVALKGRDLVVRVRAIGGQVGRVD